MHFGNHLILDCSGCDPEKIRDKENTNTFIEVLAKLTSTSYNIDVLIGSYVREWIEEPHLGLFFMRPLNRGHISGHLVYATNAAYIDLFSTAEFKESEAIQIVRLYYTPKHIYKKYHARQTLS